MDEESPVGHAGCLLAVVADPDQRPISVTRPEPVVHQTFDGPGRLGIDRGGGLVEQQDLGVELYRPQQGRDLSLAAG